MLTFRCLWDAPSHLPQSSGQAYQRTHQLAWPKLWLSLMGLMLVVMLLVSRSKSGQKIEKLSKSPKSSKVWKICKDHWFGGTFTKTLILHKLDTMNSSFRLSSNSFSSFFLLSPGALSMLFSLWLTIKELLMLCHVFCPEEPGRSSSWILKSFTSCDQRPLYIEFLSMQRIFFFHSNLGDTLRKKTSKPRIRAERLDC